MHYVYLNDGVVVDQCQINPYNVFNEFYASQFIEVADEVTFGWVFVDGVWIAPVEPISDVKEQNKAQAMQLLKDTDWTATMDVSDPQYSNPYLANQTEFLQYRSEVRKIAINPPSEEAIFPQIPTEVWQTI